LRIRRLAARWEIKKPNQARPVSAIKTFIRIEVSLIAAHTQRPDRPEVKPIPRVHLTWTGAAFSLISPAVVRMPDDNDRPWALTLEQANLRRRAIDVLTGERADERIRALTEVEAYYAVKEIGLEDAGPVLALMEPTQLRAVLDLDVWHRHQLQIPDLLIWLEALREASPSQLVAAAKALDLETLALLFRRRLHVVLKPREDDPEEEIPGWFTDPPEAILPLVETPDGRFVIAARAIDEVDLDDSDAPLDEEQRKAILQLVDELYKDEDWEHIAGALRLASTDLASTLEEDALRFRTARIEDLGFPPFERALEIYGPLDPAVLDRARPAPRGPTLEEQLPALYVRPLLGGLFDHAMSELTDEKIVQRIEGDLVPAANSILIADGRDPGDLEGLKASLSALKGYLEIALGHGVPEGERIEAAKVRLTTFHLIELFRVGYTLTLRIAARARRVIARSLKLEDVEQAVLDALGRKRPRYSPVLEPVAERILKGVPAKEAFEKAGYAPRAAEPGRAFQSLAELEATEAAVAELEELAEALERGSFVLAADNGLVVPPAPERTVLVLIATATARLLLKQKFEARPLDAEALLDLADVVAESDPVKLESEVVTALEGQPKAIVSRAKKSLLTLRQALSPLVGASEIDPRFVGIVLCRLG
jgi:hypothetical protein